MNEGRDSELCLLTTQQVMQGPWGGALLVVLELVIVLAVPGWGAP